MGVCTQVVGTPAYCAPEALDLQPLDARSDLFSLGATLCFALTGMHAFAGKTFAQVRQLWDTPPARPSVYVPELPSALESLVMDLLKVDPAGRPANAGELMEQLAAITGLTMDEHSSVMQAYLSTPNMVGREHELEQVRARLMDTAQGHGGAVLIRSASGSGRSRFLAACQLEAKLSEALVVHAASAESAAEYGVMRALGRTLIDLVPELASSAAHDQREILQPIVPELAALGGAPISEPASKPQRAQVLKAMLAWFAAVARERTLLMAIDDLHRSDEPSAACISWLAHACHEHAILLVATSEAEASAIAPAALKVYERHAQRMWLDNLSEGQAVELLRSVFGSVPHVQALGRKLYTIAAGNPRDTMRLAQNLVDQGAAKYRAGAWSLPTSFDAGWLPESMHQAALRDLDALDPGALQLARVLALADDRALSFEECAAACGGVPTRWLHEALQQLLQIQLVKLEAERYSIAHRGLQQMLRRTFDPEALHSAHAQIAEVFARRGDEPFRHCKHLLLSGDARAGVDALVRFSVTTQARTDNDPTEYVQLVLSMPDDWFDVFDAAIASCSQLARPRSDVFRLRNRVAGLLNVMGATSHLHLLELIRQLYRDSGLDAYAGLDPTLERGERLKRALSAAKQQYENSPEHERGLEPTAAIRSLARGLILASGLVALGLDYALWKALPSMSPLEALSPAFGVIERLVGAVAARVAGRHDHARAVYRQILERLAQPDLAGLEPSNHRFLRFGVMYGLALIEAGMGLPSSLEWAQILETEPLHAVNALQVRLVYQLWVGRAREADLIREAVELRRIENGSRQMGDGAHLLWQILAHAYSDDLMRLKQVVEELRELAGRHPAWASVLQYGLAEHQRLRGASELALDHLLSALGQASSGTHQLWPHAAGAHVRTLCALQRVEEAVQVGEAYLQAAERAELGSLATYIRMPLALACARLEQHARALELSPQALQSCLDLGSSGLNLVLVYETCSRVAWHAGNLVDHRHYALRCIDACKAMNGQALRARSERLLRGGADPALGPSELTPEAPLSALSQTTLEDLFSADAGPSERADTALRLLLSQSGSQSGALYLLGEHGPALVASVGPEPAAELAASVRQLIDAELQVSERETASVELDTTGIERSANTGAHQLVLLCHQTSDAIVISGVAALAISPSLQFNHLGSLAARLSRLLAEAGDVLTLL